MLWLIVVDQRHPLDLVSLPDDNVPRIFPAPIDLLEPPNLASNPAIALALNIALDDIAILSLLIPLALEMLLIILVVIRQLGKLDPLGMTLDSSEEVVFMLCPFAGDLSSLGRAFDRASTGLFDIDVKDTLVVSVLLDDEGDGYGADSFAEEEVDALECQDRVEIVGLGLVLHNIHSKILKTELSHVPSQISHRGS